MPEAYVLINCDSGFAGHIVEKISALEGVKEVSRLDGAYDVIVKVQSESDEVFRKTIAQEIRRFPNILSTLTMLVTRK